MGKTEVAAGSREAKFCRNTFACNRASLSLSTGEKPPYGVAQPRGTAAKGAEHLIERENIGQIADYRHQSFRGALQSPHVMQSPSLNICGA